MKTVLTAIASLAIMTTSATADQVCMGTAKMQSSLIDWYGERPVSGPSEDNTRLWVSDATGSWTLIRMMPDGQSCVDAQGENWTPNMDPQEVVASINMRTEG